MDDFIFENHGSVILIRPLNERARERLDELVTSESWQWFGGALAVEPRYAEDIMAALADDGGRSDYKRHDPRGWCGDPKRGAALGRPTVRGPASYAGPLTLRRVRLDSGGYDPNGTYFGYGRPLYWYADDDGEIDGTLRADDRADARAQVLALYPNARVRR